MKIDRSFVDGIGTSSEASAFAWKIIELAHTLDLQVIAEGVQNYEQLDELRTSAVRTRPGLLLRRTLPSRPVARGFPQAGTARSVVRRGSHPSASALPEQHAVRVY